MFHVSYSKILDFEWLDFYSIDKSTACEKLQIMARDGIFLLVCAKVACSNWLLCFCRRENVEGMRNLKYHGFKLKVIGGKNYK